MEDLNRTIFISYSWTSPEHQNWVVELAEMLTRDGVEVKLDVWHLKDGNDVYSYMEQMVNSKDIDRVLIILDKGYKEKADDRKGGVGTETQIISPEIYNKVLQEKFVPIIKERDDNGESFIPTFLKSTKYIDLSNTEKFEENYESLLRNIYNKPSHRKPKKGNPPSYITEDVSEYYKTSQILKGLQSQLERHPKRLNNIITDFFYEYNHSLKAFKLDLSRIDNYVLGERIYENLQKYDSLKNDLLLFISFLSKTELDYDIDIVTNFLENLFLFLKSETGTTLAVAHDNYKIIIQETYIYFIAIGLKNKNYKFIEELLYSNYYIKDGYNEGVSKNFEVFFSYVDSLKKYFEELNNRSYANTMAEVIIERIPKFLSKEEFIQADILLHYVSILQKHTHEWFPITYIYSNVEKFELFYKMESIRHFEKVKKVFNVQNPIEFQEILIGIKNDGVDREIGYGFRFRNSLQQIHEAINIDSIGTKR